MTATAWRGLGRPDDLDIPFRGDPAEVTTRVLETCAGDGPSGTGDPWDLTLAGRIGGLAAVLMESQSEEGLGLRLECPAPGCGQGFEAEVPLATVRELGRRAEGEPVVELPLGDGRSVRVRRPTGRDLRRWREQAWDDPGSAEREVAASLVVPDREGDPVDLEGALSHLAEAMDEADPLPSFRLATRCPHCGTDLELGLDLEACLLDRLERRRRRSLREIHRLASRYGWTETEVMAVAPWRRAEYLRLIDEGAA